MRCWREQGGLIPKDARQRAGELGAIRLDYYGLPHEAGLGQCCQWIWFPALADQVTALGNQVLLWALQMLASQCAAAPAADRIGGGKRKQIEPTVSPYPGTTVNVSRWHCPGGLILADSPGFVPGGRISDLLAPDLAQQVIPHKTLSSHLYEVKEGDTVCIKGLCAVECIGSTAPGLLIGFSGSGVKWQKSSGRQLDKWLEKDNDAAPVKDWEEHIVQLEAGQDLFLSGLGWVSARKAKYKLRLHIPAGAEYTVRPNLVGPKKK